MAGVLDGVELDEVDLFLIEYRRKLTTEEWWEVEFNISRQQRSPPSPPKSTGYSIFSYQTPAHQLSRQLWSQSSQSSCQTSHQSSSQSSRQTSHQSSPRSLRAKPVICKFCKKNKEDERIFSSHALHDQTGKVMCPKLRSFTCPLCAASGDLAHTIKYCPMQQYITLEEALQARLAARLPLQDR